MWSLVATNANIRNVKRIGGSKGKWYAFWPQYTYGKKI